MIKRSSIVLSLLILGIGIPALNANGVIIEHLFTGQVTEQSILFPEVLAGDPFTAILRYDTAEVPVVVDNTAFYTAFTFEVILNGLVFARDPITTLVVENDSILGDRLLIDGVGIGQAGFGLEDPSGTVFNSFALPTVLDVADFAVRDIIVVTGADLIRGEITSVSTSVAVVQPSTLLLLLAGAVSIGVVFRRGASFPLSYANRSRRRRRRTHR